MTGNNLEIPPNARIRQEYVKCGNPDCQHGPYLYAYWKDTHTHTIRTYFTLISVIHVWVNPRAAHNIL